MQRSITSEPDGSFAESTPLDEAIQILHLHWENLEDFASAVSELLKALFAARMLFLGYTDTTTGVRQPVYSDSLSELDRESVYSFRQRIEECCATFLDRSHDIPAATAISTNWQGRNRYSALSNIFEPNGGMGVIFPVWDRGILVDILIEPINGPFDQEQKDLFARLIPHLEIACTRSWPQENISRPQPVGERLKKCGLTARQVEVVTWTLEGKTNPEIGCILGISVHSVKNHLAKAYPKLGIENRAALFAKFLV